MSSIRLGTASPRTQSTTAATLSHLAELSHRAATQKIDIFLLPEAYIGGYPRGSAFGCAIGERTAQGREEFARYFEQAVDLGDTVGDGAGAGQRWIAKELGDGETPRGDGTREKLESIAKETGVFLVVGCIERAGGSLYCAVVYVCPKAGIIGKRRKVMPTGTERLIWAQGCPSTLRAVGTTIRGTRINLAAAICWESYMPLLRQSLYAQNINLYLAPTADARDAWLGLLRTIGVEGRCFVVSSNMAVREDPKTTVSDKNTQSGERRSSVLVEGGFEIAMPKATQRRKSSVIVEDGHEIAMPKIPEAQRKRRKSVFDDGNEIVLGCDDDEVVEEELMTKPQVNGTTNASTSATKWTCRGGSSIVSPFGDVLAGPQWEDDEGLIFTDVDFRDCIKGRLDMDAGGSYSRNDAFKLNVKGLNMDPLPY